jgi:hypothetical protein
MISDDKNVSKSHTQNVGTLEASLKKRHVGLGMVAHISNPSYLEAKIGSIMAQG